tara:strand:+ start:397 stop:1134 length:738 start_codon:yes stop_codon:yes gene_type:complete
MADLSLINIGNSANDGTGDDLREAFVKVNSNLNLINNEVATLDQTTASNAGSGVEIFAGETSNNLSFKTLVAGTNVGITFDSTTITIANTQPAFTVQGDGVTQTDISTYNNLLKVESVGTVDTVTIEDNKVKIATALVNDLSPSLGGNLQGNDYRVVADMQGDIYASDDSSLIIDSQTQTFYGNVDGTLGGTDFTPYLTEYDFGSFSTIQVNNVFDLIISTSNVEFGSVTSPSAIDLDLGELVSV